MNVVVLVGQLSSEPTVRELPSGSVLMSFELTTQVPRAMAAPAGTKPSTRRGEADATVSISVPLVWFDPPKKVTVGAGDQVTAVGFVRRRFYRTGTVTQSRTEVVVQLLGKAGDKRVLVAQSRWLAGAMGAQAPDGLLS